MNESACTRLLCLPAGAGFAAALAVAGCATPPDEMPAQYVSPVQYENYDCDQISAEMERVSRRVNELYLSLKKTADNDAAQMGIGLVLFWPALFFLEGGDSPQAAEYGRLKGEYEALESTAVRKRCTVPTAAKITRWTALARDTAEESCADPGAPKLIAATGDQEDYHVPCGNEAPVIVRCEAGECRVLE